MRYKEYGKFDTEFADFTARKIRGLSIIIDNAGSNADGGGWNITDGITGDAAWTLATDPWGSTKSFHTIALARLRAELGHTPVLLRARWRIHLYGYDGSYPSSGQQFGLFRCVPGRIVQNQATYRYRATGVTYEGDAYSPVHGADVAGTPFATTLIPLRQVFGYLDSFDVTNELLYHLRANRDMQFLMRWLPLGSRREGAVGATAYWNVRGKRPYLEISYLQNLEFFAANPATGAIDLTKLLDSGTGSSNDWFYLGALERGETGSPVKLFLRNFGSRTFPLVVVMRRHPRWTVPVQTAGTGTGQLDYVQLADDAVWQKYTVTFTSATAYSVKAEAYRKHPVGLNPTGGGTGWTGTTSANWTAPSGGLTIPAAAWQPGTAVNDVFEFAVAGTDTDASWPADSDDQVEITHDVSGAPDGSGWRSIVAALTRSTAAVTISAATMKIPTRALIPTMWAIGSRAFIGNASGVHHGTVDAVHTAAIGTPTFSGTGLNDLTASGNYNGTSDLQFLVRVDGPGTPDTFRWSLDGGSTWEATGVAMTGDWQPLAHGLRIRFNATTGHTSGDEWTIQTTCWGVTLSGLTADSTVYGAGAVVSTGLPITNLAPGVWAKTTAACGAGQSPANRIPVTDTTGFAASDVVLLQDLDQPEVNEVATVGSVGANFLDATANLAQQFAAGALVVKAGSGERAIWARARATISTQEEIKIFRLGVEA